MNNHSWVFYGSVAIAVLTAMGVFAHWTSGSTPAGLQSSADIARGSTKSRLAKVSVPIGPEQSAPKIKLSSASQKLRMDAALGPHEERIAQDAYTSAGEQRTHAKLASSGAVALNLRVPATDPRDALLDSNGAQPTLPADDPAESAAERKAMLELEGQPRPTPEIESYSLFNPEYGLRGFMKQSWVNNSFGVQGGLGFNDGRRIRSDSDKISDEIAVGMGVIMAF